MDITNPNAPPKQSALTIIATGNAPLSSVINCPGPNRYIFYDAPLKELDGNHTYNPAISPMASASFSSLVGSRWIVPRLAKERILDYVKTAHNQGIAARVTEPIDFPAWIRCVVVFSLFLERIFDDCRNLPRNLYWQMLLDCGVDWLDVDDLYSAGQF